MSARKAWPGAWLYSDGGPRSALACLRGISRHPSCVVDWESAGVWQHCAVSLVTVARVAHVRALEWGLQYSCPSCTHISKEKDLIETRVDLERSIAHRDFD